MFVKFVIEKRVGYIRHWPRGPQFCFCMGLSGSLNREVPLTNVLMKEQSPCPECFVGSDKTRGPEGFVANKTQGQGDCSYYNMCLYFS